MALQLTYPGVYVQELPSGTHTIAGAATSITAFVGYLERGPLNTPVQCLNFGDFQRVFGGLDQNSITSFQVSQFFLNGGVEAWVSRLYASSAPPVQPTILLLGALPPTTPPTPSSGPPKLTKGSDLLTLLSQNPGTWGGTIFVTVDYMTNKPNTFNLTATLYATSSNSSSSGVSYSVVQTQSVPGCHARSQPAEFYRRGDAGGFEPLRATARGPRPHLASAGGRAVCQRHAPDHSAAPSRRRSAVAITKQRWRQQAPSLRSRPRRCRRARRQNAQFTMTNAVRDGVRPDRGDSGRAVERSRRARHAGPCQRGGAQLPFAFRRRQRRAAAAAPGLAARSLAGRSSDRA